MIDGVNQAECINENAARRRPTPACRILNSPFVNQLGEPHRSGLPDPGRLRLCQCQRARHRVALQVTDGGVSKFSIGFFRRGIDGIGGGGGSLQ